MSFIHLHTYSAYSLLSSTASVPSLVKAAKGKGFKAMALTDRNVMYGTIEFYKECMKQGIRPILGLTADILSNQEQSESFPLVLLAKNKIGFHNLLKISSAIQTKSQEGLPLKWLRHYAEGIIALTPGLEGEIETLLLAGREEAAYNLARTYSDIFQGGFFLALQNHGLEKEFRLLELLTRMASELGIGVASSNAVHYLEASDALAHECLLAIRDGMKLQDKGRSKLDGEGYYLKTAAEMAELFANYPEALENTLRIAETCTVEIEFGKIHMPKYPLEKEDRPDEVLEHLCFEGLEKRVPGYSSAYVERLQFEISVIKNMKYENYFLIVWDFMKYARERGILTGPGRGSAAGSLVAYTLFITDVDPLEHGLLFERFLNPERVTMPDIDIDFPDHRRDEIIEYVARKYGELHVAQIATFGTLAAKASIRDVGRAFGLNTKELDMWSKAIPSRIGITLEEAYRDSKRLRDLAEESPFNQKLFQTAMKLEGLPRHTSTHAAGVVISEQPLVDFIPIQEGHNHIYLTQYSMEYLEEIGLLKMDFLGLRNLSLIESIVSSIEREENREIDVRSIPLNDVLTFELLARGETTGIFQLESEGMRKVLTRLRPTRFEDIVAVNALYRPGPMENIPLFIDRKHGRESIAYPHEDLKPILENTYGVIVYQEQIMQVASTMAGFSLGEADLLRRAVGKKKKDVLDREREHFVNGALRKGYGSSAANTVYDLIVRFANYGFNKSHAVAYSVISCQLAYLKAHHPEHFMAGLLTSVSGNDVKIAQYIRELKGMEIPLLPPSVNRSTYSFKAEKGGIRFGLGGIKGLGAPVIREIINERRKKPFADLFDFCIRVSKKTTTRKILEALTHSGSFDEFGKDRATLLASLDVAIDHAQLMRPDDDEQAALFMADDLMPKPKYMEVDPISLENKLAFEKDVLGFYLSSHPLSVHEKALHESGARPLAEITPSPHQQAIGIFITALKKIRTKKGDPMAFLTITDSSGEMEAVAFPEVFKKYSTLFSQGIMAVLEGKVENRDGKNQFIIKKAEQIENWLKTQHKERLYLKLLPENQDPARLAKLESLLAGSRGTIEVVLYYDGLNKTLRLGADYGIKPTEYLLAQLSNLLGKNNVVLK
ncbi:DNA polymerase III subunit alpha [Neobacillus notoginsengisoli]|uniref:DNA polymerase III subunit alpha n=1 Tax=Neobacillus notoginsengisoli TaxID=1578198 RepID=A0A417YU82_9BACI|nr:DNA polymerase III subunit alpha [Neobacillus notoginsengisoli]RHW40733.1 DNA polymerase III subunit alpha [Neobacillus notoginsengisoli]